MVQLKLVNDKQPNVERRLSAALRTRAHQPPPGMLSTTAAMLQYRSQASTALYWHLHVQLNRHRLGVNQHISQSELARPTNEPPTPITLSVPTHPAALRVVYLLIRIQLDPHDHAARRSGQVHVAGGDVTHPSQGIPMPFPVDDRCAWHICPIPPPPPRPIPLHPTRGNPTYQAALRVRARSHQGLG